LFAGSDGGAKHWAIIASLVETCKLNDVDPLADLTDAFIRIVNGHQTATSMSSFRGPIAVTPSKLWPENDAYSNRERV
jgi:hypothetical protein